MSPRPQQLWETYGVAMPVLTWTLLASLQLDELSWSTLCLLNVFAIADIHFYQVLAMNCSHWNTVVPELLQNSEIICVHHTYGGGGRSFMSGPHDFKLESSENEPRFIQNKS